MDDKGPVSGQLFIYETDPNDITNISNEPITVLGAYLNLLCT